MRAWQVHRHGSPHEALRLIDLDEPVPGPGEVRLRVRAAGIGAPDAFMCRATYALTPSLPFVAGQEVCGIVDAVGDGVPLAPGTRLMGVTSFTDGRGGFAEKTIVPAVNAYRVPDEMTDADAAGFRIGYSTAWIGLVRRGQLAAGETVLVLGAAGGSGITAVQLAKALGARVVAVAAGAEKLAFCARLGADVCIDRTTTANVAHAVRDATEGRGVDVVYDPVGGDAAANATRCIAPFGRLLVVGFASGAWAKVDSAHLVGRNYSVIGVYAAGFTREQNEADHEALLALHADGRIGGFVSTMPFAELPEALDAVAAGTVIGKLAVIAD